MSRKSHRSLVTFVLNEAVGVVIILHELFLREGERPFFLALAGALMGLPFVLAADGKLTSRWGAEENDDDKEERWSHLP